MNGSDAWNDGARIEGLRRQIAALAEKLERPLVLMEVCGTHTHAIAAAGLRSLLPRNVRLVSGPGCPVCVTPIDYLDHALALGRLTNVTLCSFGDLVRVPASRRASLEQARAEGSDVRIVYSPREALEIARALPRRTVVFLAVGFETTVPTIAGVLAEAEATRVPNFRVLSGCKVIGPPLRALVADPRLRVDGFLLPGHVSVVLGADFYRFLPEQARVPGVIVGFTPVDILGGIEELVRLVHEGRPAVVNRYTRLVSAQGNRVALRLMERFFEPVDTRWRGLGPIALSGLGLRPEWAARDAARLPVEIGEPLEPKGCRCGEILTGAIDPPACPLYARGCTPEHPVGACMVSGEGTCAAWYRHARHALEVPA